MMKIYNLFKTRKALVILLLISFLMPVDLVACCIPKKYPVFIPSIIQEIFYNRETFLAKVVEKKSKDIKFEVLKVYKGKKEKYKFVNIDGDIPPLLSSVVGYSDDDYSITNAKIGDKWILSGYRGKEDSVIYPFYRYSSCGWKIKGTRPYSDNSLNEKLQLSFLSFFPNIYIKPAFYIFYGFILIAISFFIYKIFSFPFIIIKTIFLSRLHLLKSQKKFLKYFLLLLTLIITNLLTSFIYNNLANYTVFYDEFLVTKYRMFAVSKGDYEAELIKLFDNNSLVIFFSFIDKIINNISTIIIMMLLPLFVAVFIFRKLYKYIKKRRELVSD